MPYQQMVYTTHEQTTSAAFAEPIKANAEINVAATILDTQDDILSFLCAELCLKENEIRDL